MFNFFLGVTVVLILLAAGVALFFALLAYTQSNKATRMDSRLTGLTARVAELEKDKGDQWEALNKLRDDLRK